MDIDIKPQIIASTEHSASEAYFYYILDIGLVVRMAGILTTILSRKLIMDIDIKPQIIASTEHSASEAYFYYILDIGLVVRIPRSHRGGRGSIPRLGILF
ncbi:hypothetical protein DPMN_120083 [Dreissena polymorpha]|uniref:Uncharacterized protein n=1 Tax=Dreissena polymorpha TaxID=45954 RepID=A0A9D4GN03_DREPO|nr:hypothetical protein DPMN_120083 [Dreissena polymorpha]